MESKHKELEEIVRKFRLRACEVVSGLGDGKVFRVDFIAKDDNGKPLVAGSAGTCFADEDNPRDFTNKLRTLADQLDKYWEKAFPAACSASTPSEPKLEVN